MSRVSKEIAHNIFLLRDETQDAIVYSLDNAKYKRIVFKMDFRGSENLRLATGGLQREVVVPPYSKVEVAYLQARGNFAWYFPLHNAGFDSAHRVSLRSVLQ